MSKFVQFTQEVGTRESEDDQVTLVVAPVIVNVEFIRSFSKRKPEYNTGTERPGTRIAFVNSAALIVTESYDEVKAKVIPN